MYLTSLEIVKAAWCTGPSNGWQENVEKRLSIEQALPLFRGVGGRSEQVVDVGVRNRASAYCFAYVSALCARRFRSPQHPLPRCHSSAADERCPVVGVEPTLARMNMDAPEKNCLPKGLSLLVSLLYF